MKRSVERLASGSAGGARLRVLQWNVLADGLAQEGDFIKVRKGGHPGVMYRPFYAHFGHSVIDRCDLTILRPRKTFSSISTGAP